jgi:hypothetical protein
VPAIAIPLATRGKPAPVGMDCTSQITAGCG